MEVFYKVAKEDEISLVGTTLTINGVNYDLENPVKISEENAQDIFNGNIRYYLDGSELDGTMIHMEKPTLLLHISFDASFMFINGNMMRFHDVNNDRDISPDELKTIIDHYNMSDEDRKNIHQTMMDNYLETHTKEEWKAKGKK